MSTVLRGPADADHYRVKVGRFRERWYTDPLPADDIAPAIDKGAVWPSVSHIKGASSKDWTFVGLKRVAEALRDRPTCLDGLSYDECYDRLKSINRLGLKQAQERGTGVHLYMERGLRGEEIKAWMPDEPGADYIPAVRNFFATYQPELIAAEVVCIDRDLNGFGYGGTSDGLISLMLGGERKTAWVDWKSRGDSSDHGAYEEEAAQLGAYASAQYMLVEGPNGPQRSRLPQADLGLIVSIRTDGVRLYPVDLDDAADYYRGLHSWWVKQRTSNAGIGQPLAPQAIPTAEPVDYVKLAAAATSVEELTALFHRATADDAWNHTVATSFTIRKNQIMAAA